MSNIALCTGEGGLAALDLLSVCNLVNYFGKSDSIFSRNITIWFLRTCFFILRWCVWYQISSSVDIDEISVFPILFTKGTSKVIISVARLTPFFLLLFIFTILFFFPILFLASSFLTSFFQLSLYGLGAIRDERLHRTFAQKKVKFMRPTEALEDWFNVFVLHQNRYAWWCYNDATQACTHAHSDQAHTIDSVVIHFCIYAFARKLIYKYH